jgi:hypothetical protein
VRPALAAQVATCIDHLSLVAGMYVIMAWLSIYFLLRRHRPTRGRTITILYTAFMLVITVAWYIPSCCCAMTVPDIDLLRFFCSAIVAEGQLLEPPAPLWYCSATNQAGNVMSQLQFWGSDALLVSLVFLVRGNMLTIPVTSQLYRTLVIFEWQWTIVILPAAIYISSVGMCSSVIFGLRILKPCQGLESLEAWHASVSNMAVIFLSLLSRSLAQPITP